MPENPDTMDDTEAPLDLSKVKKKSKKAPPSFLTDPDATGEPTPGTDGSAGGDKGGAEDEGGSLNFKQMKKKKKPAINLDELVQVDPLADDKDGKRNFHFLL